MSSSRSSVHLLNISSKFKELYSDDFVAVDFLSDAVSLGASLTSFAVALTVKLEAAAETSFFSGAFSSPGGFDWKKPPADVDGIPKSAFLSPEAAVELNMLGTVKLDAASPVALG